MDKKAETFVSPVVIEQVISRPGIWVCVLFLSGDLLTCERAAPLVDKFHSWQRLDWIGCLPIYASWTGNIYIFFSFLEGEETPMGPKYMQQHLYKQCNPRRKASRGSIHHVCLRAKSLQSCPTLWDPRDSRHQAPLSGILQTRILEWVVKPSSRGSSQPRNWIHIFYVSCIDRQILYH